MISVPTNWELTTLGSLAEDISYGYTASATPDPVGPKLLRITDIQEGQVDWTTVPHCREGASPKFFLQDSDIVIARTGATTGKSFLIRAVPERAVFASYLIRVRTSGGINPEYLSAFLQSPDYWSQIQVVSKGTAQPGANASILSSLEVPLAPPDEQRRIVVKIDSLSTKSKRARDHLDHVARLVEKYKQAILARVFDPSQDGQSVTFGDVVDLLNGDRSQNYPSDDEQLPAGYCLFLGTRNVRQGFFDFSDTSYITKEKHQSLRGGTLSRGDIVLTIRGTLGNCAIYDDTVPFDVVRINSAMIIVRPKVAADPHYLMWALRSPLFLGWAGSNARGSAQPHLRAADIQLATLYFPDLSEQKSLVRRIHSAFAWIDRLASEATSARKLIDHLDQAILSKAFRGELVPQDPNDEPASVLLERIRTEQSAGDGKGRRRGRKAAN
ncbi:restriction endonuclease subunit S [Microvirga soli]|uniref:restriction endonuclease subunit S n=1 Tax=Microvirga soli TaxID=1854496 RepID=UPI00191FE625|nr:restriction endonuclease subunit S [Microvirga soli]